MDSFKLKTKNGGIGIGSQYPIRVNCNIGINSQSSYSLEVEKIDRLLSLSETSPDIMMDLSVGEVKNTLYNYILDKYDIAVGTVPIYNIFSKANGVSKNQLIEKLNEQAELGVAFFTLHLTASNHLYEKAKNERKIPSTSRGGMAILFDTIINRRGENILIENLDEIISIVNKHKVAISIGTTFRPASIIDACDNVHILETEAQLKLSQYLQKRNVNVIIENIGHIDLDNISKHSKLLRKFSAPIMPLGPLPTDNAVGNDHIASAIGAAFSGYFKCANIMNCITPNEHLSSSFSVEEIVLGVRAAKIAAHCINAINFKEFRAIDRAIYYDRANKKNCLNSTSENCLRCDELCPLNFQLQ